MVFLKVTHWACTTFPIKRISCLRSFQYLFPSTTQLSLECFSIKLSWYLIECGRVVSWYTRIQFMAPFKIMFHRCQLQFLSETKTTTCQNQISYSSLSVPPNHMGSDASRTCHSASILLSAFTAVSHSSMPYKCCLSPGPTYLVPKWTQWKSRTTKL